MARTVLVVDDIKINRILLRRILEGDNDVLEAENGQDAMSFLMKAHLDVSVILLDLVMPVMDGFEVLERIRQNPSLSQIPVIVITGSTDPEAEEKALALGATDFITKPFNEKIIRRRIQNLVRLRESAQMVNIYRRDRLTGLLNRDSFFETATRYIKRKPAGFYCMSCIDIDGFKMINDRYGVEKGDTVLRTISAAIRKECDSNFGACGRITADNFVSLLPISILESPELSRDRFDLSSKPGVDLPITISIGRYIVDDPTLSVSAMYDRAKLAQRAVKGRFDRHVAIYDESMRDDFIREQEIIHEMKPALSGGQFEVWYQPQYNHASGALIGAEALARWRHPSHGLILPGEFVGVFERSGFIYELDRFVWERAASDLRRWIDSGLEPLPISVNISRFDLLSDDLVPTLVHVTEKYGISEDLLRLEVTESAFADSKGRVALSVKQLIGHGFTVEIDDFGSGYSSLNTLKDVPAQILKLDMRFMENEGDVDRGGNILESIVRMSRWIGMSVIAEGVELPSQADYLLSIGCTYIQGYLYAKPMPREEYAALLSRAKKEDRLVALVTAETLDNSAFWDPASTDTLIFNSYVGAACIFEYREGVTELIRATSKFAKMIGGDSMLIQDALKLGWRSHIESSSLDSFDKSVKRSRDEGNEVTGEYLFIDLPSCPKKTYLRMTLRVIARSGENCLVYCVAENTTARREAEKKERELASHMRAFIENVPGGIYALTLENDKAKPLFVNAGFYEIFGYTKEEFEAIGMGLGDVLLPDGNEKLRSMFASVEKTGVTSRLEVKAIKRDGTKIDVRIGDSLCRPDGVGLPVHITVFTDITSEKAKERSERETIQLVLSAIMESSPDLAFAKDKDLRYLCCTRPFAEMAGLSDPRDVAGKTDDELFDSATAAMYKSDDELLFKSGVSLTGYIEAIPSTDGIPHYSSTSKFILRDSLGNIAGLYGTGRDVTDVRAAFDRLKLVNDGIPGGIANYSITRDSARLTYFNDGFCKMLGCTREEYSELSKKSVVNRVLQEDLPLLEKSIAEFRETGKPINVVFRSRRFDDDRIIWINLMGSLVGESDDTMHVGALLLDVTPEYEASRREREMADRMDAILKSVSDGIAATIFDENGKPTNVFANDTYFSLLGYTRDEFNSELESPMSTVYPEDLAYVRSNISSLLEKGGGALLEYRCVKRDGSVIHVRNKESVTEIEGIDGRVLIAVISDVTREKEREQSIRNANAQFSAIISNIDGGVAALAMQNGAFRCLYSNDRYSEMFGYTRDEFEREHKNGIMDIILPEDIERVRKVMHGNEGRSGSTTMQFRAICRDGSIKWLRSGGTVCRLEGIDAPVHVVILTDISSEVAVFEELRESEERFRIATETSGMLIGRYDVKKHEFTHNDKELLKAGIPEVIKDLPNAFTGDSRTSSENTEAIRGLLERIEKGETPCSCELRMQKSGGAARSFMLEANVIMNAERRPSQAIIVARDITEQREKEAVYKRWQQSISDRPENSYTFFRWNISRDTAIGSFEGTLLDIDADEVEVRSFSENTAAYASRRVYPDDRSAYLSFLDLESILSMYRRGVHSGAFEYREITDTGLRWRRASVELVEYLSSQEIEAYIMYEDVDKKKKADLLIRERAERDPLTGVLNRSAFAIQAEKAGSELEDGLGFALLMMDVDGFKQLNDALGHSMGDRVLVELSHKLRSILRPSDLLGRIGGDEFVIGLRNIRRDRDIAAKADQICSILRQNLANNVNISVSIGIAVSPRDGSDFATIYKKADDALYRVKNTGKDGYFFSSHEDGTPFTGASAVGAPTN